MFVDDLQLMAGLLADLARLYNFVLDLSLEFGIIVNSSKLTLNTPRSFLSVGTVTSEQVGLPPIKFSRCSKYLGCMISMDDFDGNVHVQMRINSAACALTRAQSRGLWGGGNMMVPTRNIITKVIVPMAVYGIDSFSLKLS